MIRDFLAQGTLQNDLAVVNPAPASGSLPTRLRHTTEWAERKRPRMKLTSDTQKSPRGLTCIERTRIRGCPAPVAAGTIIAEER